MAKYRKKPVVVEAEQWNPTIRQYNWLDRLLCWLSVHCWYKMPESKYCMRCGKCYIETLEGRMTVSEGDWIITGIKHERYPCKPDIFEATYEKVED